MSRASTERHSVEVTGREKEAQRYNSGTLSCHDSEMQNKAKGRQECAKQIIGVCELMNKGQSIKLGRDWSCPVEPKWMSH